MRKRRKRFSVIRTVVRLLRPDTGGLMTGTFRADDLVVVATAESFRVPGEPELRIGDVVMLNSGGPVGLIVDTDGSNIVFSWRVDGKTYEMESSAACFHRVRELW